jgi:hypothetical protein
MLTALNETPILFWDVFTHASENIISILTSVFSLVAAREVRPFIDFLVNQLPSIGSWKPLPLVGFVLEVYFDEHPLEIPSFAPSIHTFLVSFYGMTTSRVVLQSVDCSSFLKILAVRADGLPASAVSDFLTDFTNKLMQCPANHATLYALFTQFQPESLPTFAVQLPIDSIIELIPKATTASDVASILRGHDAAVILPHIDREFILKWPEETVLEWLTEVGGDRRDECDAFIATLFPSVGTLPGYVRAEALLAGQTVRPYRPRDRFRLAQPELSEAEHFLKSAVAFLSCLGPSLAGSGLLAHLCRLVQAFKLAVHDFNIGELGALLFALDDRDSDPNIDLIEFLRIFSTAIDREQVLHFFESNSDGCLAVLKPARMDSCARLLHWFDAFRSQTVCERLFGTPLFEQLLTETVAKRDHETIQWIHANSGGHQSALLRLLWRDPAAIFGSAQLSSFLKGEPFDFRKEEAHRVICQFLIGPPQADHVGFVRNLVRLHGFVYSSAITARITAFGDLLPDYFALLLDCALLSPEFASTLVDASIPALDGGPFSGLAFGRVLRLAFHSDVDNRPQRILDIVMVLADHLDAVNSPARAPAVDALCEALDSEDLSADQAWPSLLFEEFMELENIASPSIRDFLGKYLRKEADSFDGHLDGFGAALVSGGPPEALRRSAAFLPIFFDAWPDRKAEFLAAYPPTREVIAEWPVFAQNEEEQ